MLFSSSFFLHFPKAQNNRERKTTLLVIKLVLSARSFEEDKERGQREFAFVLLVVRARGWVFCARERERERLDFPLVVEKSPFGSRGIIIIFIRGANLLSIKQQRAHI